MAQPVETASIEATETDEPGEQSSADVPTSPASLWVSEGKVTYSITHTDHRDTREWVDCDSVVTTD